VPDQLRDLLDLVLASLDDAGSDGRALARQAGFSRDHLDRILAAAVGETPAALRRRLLLERAAWQLRAATTPATQVAAAAGYGSLAAFSRAFARAHGVPPSAFADSGRPVQLPAPNGLHFHPPGGLLVPGARTRTRTRPARDLTERLVGHHLDRSRVLLGVAAQLPPGELEREVRPGLVVVWFEGPEPSAGLMAERLVHTLEVWIASVLGEPVPPMRSGPPHERFDRAATRFARFARSVRDRGAWDDAFVDALCEPPEMFTYGGVLAHVLTYGALRREALAGVLAELGADVPAPIHADPILWERGRA
jgi:AraC-like DNA-binding protein